MHIEIYPTHNQVPEGELKDKNVIIIDVLRATSTIVSALFTGAREVKTSSSIEGAFKLKNKDAHILLGGERDANKIEGFDFGNSPIEYISDKIQGKTIVLTTTNGTQAIEKAKGANKLIASSFLNLASVVAYFENFNEDLHIICSGTNGKFSMDDGLCAGLILHELRKIKTVSTTDFGELLTLPFKKDEFSLIELLKETYHFNILKNKGLLNDVKYCLKVNFIDLIPIWKQDGFIALKE